MTLVTYTHKISLIFLLLLSFFSCNKDQGEEVPYDNIEDFVLEKIDLSDTKLLFTQSEHIYDESYGSHDYHNLKKLSTNNQILDVDFYLNRELTEYEDRVYQYQAIELNDKFFLINYPVAENTFLIDKSNGEAIEIKYFLSNIYAREVNTIAILDSSMFYINKSKELMHIPNFYDQESEEYQLSKDAEKVREFRVNSSGSVIYNLEFADGGPILVKPDGTKQYCDDCKYSMQYFWNGTDGCIYYNKHDGVYKVCNESIVKISSSDLGGSNLYPFPDYSLDRTYLAGYYCYRSDNYNKSFSIFSNFNYPIAWPPHNYYNGYIYSVVSPDLDEYEYWLDHDIIAPKLVIIDMDNYTYVAKELELDRIIRDIFFIDEEIALINLRDTYPDNYSEYYKTGSILNMKTLKLTDQETGGISDVILLN